MPREKVIDYPNRRKGSSKTTKWVTVLLLIVSAVLMAIVTLGGWTTLQGGRLVQIGMLLVLLICAFYISRWRSGVLPVAAATAMILLIFAAISGPEWFTRDKDGFDKPELPADFLAVTTLLLVPLQILVIGFAMAGFRQKWQVEVERDADEARTDDDDGRRRGGPVAAPA